MMTTAENTRAYAAVQQERGIALIMVLWVLTVLTVMVFSFSYASRSEVLSTLSFRSESVKKYLAEAGVERAAVEIVYRRQAAPGADSDVWKTDGTAYEVAAGKGRFVVRITDEDGRVDINRSPEVILRNLFRNFGLDQHAADSLADAVMDWRDADDLLRLNGAENDYYMSLPNPYQARNSEFETLEELILVRGMTPELLYGTDGTSGIIDFLTVNARSGKINLNAAPREVLTAVPGITGKTADTIITMRSESRIDNMQLALGESYQAASRYVATADSGSYEVLSTGHAEGSPSGYAVRAILSFSADSHRTVYYKGPLDLAHE